MKNPTIAVVDYGVSNIYNIVKALERLKANVRITTKGEDITESEGLVLPGVGAFGAGAEGLFRYRLIDPIRQFAATGKPVLGICLGAQLLMTEGYEFGVFKGLDLIPGTVEHFPDTLRDVKVPHIGWNAIEGGEWDGTILASIPKGAYMYFNHSYYLKPANAGDMCATTTYGGFTYAAVLRKGNVYGAQFHPEKSADHGQMILKTFIEKI